MIKNNLPLDPIRCDIQSNFEESKDKIEIEYLSEFELENNQDGGL